MDYLNADMVAVDEAERLAGSRLIHWAMHSPAHRAAQVELAVALAKKKVKRMADKVAAQGASLDGRPMPQVALAFDILHNGRGGSSTFPKIARALDSGDPMAALAQIGRTEAFRDRIDRVAARAKQLLGTGDFGRMRYRAASNAFE
jgi:hypothetical protein